jgi:predicted acylesterase/phospholipase RssA
VRTAHFAYFDGEKIAIRPDHVMASGALPSGFPPVEIDGEQYWDGGLFSSVPLYHCRTATSRLIRSLRRRARRRASRANQKGQIASRPQAQRENADLCP